MIGRREISYLIDERTIVFILIGLVGAAATAPAITGRWIPERVRLGITALLAVLPLINLLGLVPMAYYSMHKAGFIDIVCSAFGFAFCIDNIRAPSPVNRVIGTILGLLYSFALFHEFVRAYSRYVSSST